MTLPGNETSGSGSSRGIRAEDVRIAQPCPAPRRPARQYRASTWVRDYGTKLRSAEEAVRKVKSGDAVYYSGNAAEPYVLIEKLAERYEELTDVKLNHVLLLGDDPLSRPEMEGHFRHNSLFVGPADRKAVNDGRAITSPSSCTRFRGCTTMESFRWMWP